MAVAAGLALLALAALYLIALGIVALIRPHLAHDFLGRFGQSARANWVEAAVRALIGAGAIAAAPALGAPLVWQVGGLFLIASAAWMIVFAAAHRRIARRSVAWVERFIRPLGAASIVLGAALGLAVVRGAASFADAARY